MIPNWDIPIQDANCRMVRSLHTPQYEQFRHLMMEQRVSVQLTQAELAKRLGKPQSFVSKYESGERRLDVTEFLAVCKALDVEPAPLIQRLMQAFQE